MRRTHLHRIAPALVIAILLAQVGCRPAEPPLPTYELRDEQASLRVLAERSRAIRSTAAEVGMTLTRSDGQSVRLDGAMVTQPPEKLRLQAIKFGRTVFDLTLNEDGLFVKTMDDPARQEQVVPASLSAARFAQEWSTFTGGLFEQPDLKVTSSSPAKLVVREQLPDGRTIECDVDRPTLTPRQYRMTDPSGTRRFTLTLSDYRQFGEIVHPTRLLAVSDQGTIDIRLRDLEMNGDPQPRAFKPPAGATKLQ